MLFSFFSHFLCASSSNVTPLMLLFTVAHGKLAWHGVTVVSEVCAHFHLCSPGKLGLRLPGNESALAWEWVCAYLGMGSVQLEGLLITS